MTCSIYSRVIFVMLIKWFIPEFQVCFAGNIQGIAFNNTLTIGYSIPWSHDWVVGPNMGSTILLGIEEVKRRQLLPGYDIEFVFRDSHCESRQGMRGVIDMWSTVNDLDVLFIGCSVICEPASLLAAHWNIPVVSYACGSMPLSDKSMYPTFSRAVGQLTEVSNFINAAAKLYEWTRIAIVSTTITLSRTIAEKTKHIVESNGVQVFFHTIHPTAEGKEINWGKFEQAREVIKAVKKEARVVFLAVYGIETRNLMILSLDEGLLNGEYIFISIVVNTLIAQQFDYRPEVDNVIYNGMLSLDRRLPSGPEYRHFLQRVIEAFEHPAFTNWPHIPLNASIDEIDSYAGYVHDAVLMWAYGVNKTLEEGFGPDDGLRIAHNIFNSMFQGITGNVVIDEKGDRKLEQRMEIIQNGKPLPLLDWFPAGHVIKKLYKPNKEGDWTGLVWHGNTTEMPSDSPVCGWAGELCISQEVDQGTTLYLVSSIVVILTIGTIVSILFGIRKYRYEMDLQQVESVTILWDNIQKLRTYHRSTDGSRGTISSASVSLNDGVLHQLFITAGIYNGEMVAIKAFATSVDIDFHQRQILVELKSMRAIHHENVVQFIGVCPKAPHACIVMAYASRGSVKDIIGNDDIKLTDDFKLSLLTDIANGMWYLHGSVIGSHGDLTSSKCVVDSRWTCKITGYGLGYVKGTLQPTSVNDLTEIQKYRKYLWTAPELLRMDPAPLNGSKTGDVYSFGIITQEVILEDGPFAYNDQDPVNIVQKVTSMFGEPFRPIIPMEKCSKDWLDLMSKCWNELPEARPSFSRILSMLQRFNNGINLNLVDKMINRLEYYTKHLEDRVVAHSQELETEKLKVETLLRELLPQSVARKLYSGKQVVPETFDNVTLFFSDIVGFTRISAVATPMDIVKLLNNMYTMFDYVANMYEVYKVATIGDAYMVASGVPIRNGNQHAAEICGMAIALLDSIGDFPIPHLPGEHLRLRCGIHSGPVVAGVTGLKMPRYLLFGDTVDIAGRMEALGEAMKIHISDTTKELLPSSFLTIKRGVIDVKGRGKMVSFWLIE